MKQALFVIAAALILTGCGAGHANLTSITVSPQSATTTSNPSEASWLHGDGKLSPKRKTRELSQWTGLSWKTSPYKHRNCRGHYRLDRRSYLLSAGHGYHYRKRSPKPTVHCE